MALTKIDDRGLKTPIDLLDNEKIRFGTGNDLELYHDGTTNWIDSVNNHTLIVRAGLGDAFLQGNPVWITDEGNSHTYFKGTSGGAVELYYDNAKKFETSSEGVQSSGHIRIVDDKELKVGSGNDLRIFHTGGNSYIDNYTGSLFIRNNGIYLKSNAGSENFIDCSPNAEVSLFYDNSKKFETTASGVTVTGTQKILTSSSTSADLMVGASGTGEARIYLDASNGDFSGGDYGYLKQSNGATGGVLTVANMQSGGIKFNVGAGSGGIGDALTIGSGGNVEIVNGNLVVASGHGITAHGADNSTYGELAIKVAAADNSGSSNVATFKRGSNSVINLAFPDGGGIDFSAAASGNSPTASILDDYEYGSFTPTVGASQSNGTAAYSAQNGFYIKIGRLVTIYIDVTISSWSGASGVQKWMGLPFNKNELSGQAFYYEGVSPWYVSDNLTNSKSNYQGYISDNNNALNMYVGNTVQTDSTAPINVTGRCSITFTYSTSS